MKTRRTFFLHRHYRRRAIAKCGGIFVGNMAYLARWDGKPFAPYVVELAPLCVGSARYSIVGMGRADSGYYDAIPELQTALAAFSGD